MMVRSYFFSDEGAIILPVTSYNALKTHDKITKERVIFTINFEREKLKLLKI